MPRKTPSSNTHPSGQPSANLRKLRAQIDRLDREILKVMNERARIAAQIGTIKNGEGLTIYSPSREEDVLSRLGQENPGPLAADAVRAIFRELMSGCRALERVLRVAYLGPEFSFTHLAALEKFGHTVEFIPLVTIQAIFEEVVRNQVDYGIVPLENSTDGRIVDSLDMFTRLNVKICAEVCLPIHHCLLAKCERPDLRRVYSKPQALSQCRQWLSKNLGSIQLIDVVSTARAAELAQQEPYAGAIASREAAGKYGLNVLAANIEDNQNNVTRFAVIGDRSDAPSGCDKTTLMFQIPHQAGSLSKVLLPFEKNGINLTWIESFPMRTAKREYVFFVDAEGHASEEPLKRALAALEKQCHRLVVLGSFSRPRTGEGP